MQLDDSTTTTPGVEITKSESGGDCLTVTVLTLFQP